MKYITHSLDNEQITIRCIEDGFIIDYTKRGSIVEKYFCTLKDVSDFLNKYYKEESNG